MVKTANALATSKDTASEQVSASLPELAEVETLCNDLRHMLVRSEQVLIKGDAHSTVERIERWIESYRRGLSAAQKVSDNGVGMLKKARDQLSLSLEEQLRLEDEGGNPPTREHAGDVEEITRAIRSIDQLLPLMEQSFQPTEEATKPEKADLETT